MPELPEVETVRRGLHAALKDAAIREVTLRRRGIRIPFPKGLARALEGRRITSVTRRAKYLLIHLDSGDVLIAHLGMTGRFLVEKKLPASFAAHDHAIFILKDGRAVIFNDARRFGLMTLARQDALATHPLFAGLGPEPLEKGFSAGYLKRALSARSGPIKTALMDQKLVVGVGNIYASEALFLAGIDPRKPAHRAADKAEKLVTAVRQVLKDAIASGGSSLRDFLHVSGDAGYFQHRFRVYGRGGKPCAGCDTPLSLLRQAGRSSFFCPQCQT